MAKYAGYTMALIATFLLHWPALSQAQVAEAPADTAGQVAEETPEPEGSDAGDGAGAEARADDGEVDEAANDEVIDDSDLDEQVYEEDEDDFIPSEEIPVDEAIPFPTNI